MPWCPICAGAYLDGVEKCSECDVDLVDQISLSEGDVVYVTTTGTPQETDAIQSLLIANEILPLITYPGHYIFENFHKDHVRKGVHIYVAAQSFDKARDLLGIDEESDTPYLFREDACIVEENTGEDDSPEHPHSGSITNREIRARAYKLYRKHGLFLFGIWVIIGCLTSFAGALANILLIACSAIHSVDYPLVKPLLTFILLLPMYPISLLGMAKFTDDLWTGGKAAKKSLLSFYNRSRILPAFGYILLYHFIVSLASVPDSPTMQDNLLIFLPRAALCIATLWYLWVQLLPCHYLYIKNSIKI